MNVTWIGAFFFKARIGGLIVRVSTNGTHLVTCTLSPFNDKKWISREGDKFKTYSFRHYQIEEEELVDCLTDLINDA